MIENTRIFLEVVKQGSFSRTARLLKIQKSAVSRAVRAIEDSTGTKLLHRTTRSLSLTAAGRAYFESCLGPMQALEDAERSLRGQDSMMAGSIKITAPEDLGEAVISPAIAELSRSYPELRFELHFSNEVVDLVKDGYDFAIRIGKLPESNFRARKVGVISLVLAASPKYLKDAPAIRDVADLASHSTLTLNRASIVPRWQLTRQTSKATSIITPKIIANQMSTLVGLARHGAGVALIPHYLCEPDFASGKLVHVLKGWEQRTYPVTIVSPQSSDRAVRLKICSDLLSDRILKCLGK
jgi:LysR family transcriptional regulator for bpeEF and oprC